MTTYKWGKFEKNTEYRPGEYIDDIFVDIVREEEGVPYGSYYPIRFVSLSDRDFYLDKWYKPGSNDSKPSVIMAANNPDAFVQYGSFGYKLYRMRTVYSKGSRVGTVTSTNRNAYPNDGQSGNYWYVYEGIANQEPTISGQDEDWGGYKQAFKRYYSVDDGDSGQQLNVVVTLNGVTIATVNNATRKTDYPIDINDSKFNALTLNEQNTIEITVTDSSGATAVRRYTFKRINTAPVVTMTNAHYGEQNKPFAINFEAADPDGDEITAKLFIDDVQIKDLGTIKGKQSVTIPKIDFAKIPNGEHKIRVEAKDSYNAVGAGYADFSKNLTYAWYRLKKELPEQPSAVIVNPLVELATGAKMTIKVCCNVMDSNPTWEAVPEELYGQKYNFRTKSKTANNWGVGVEVKVDKDKATDTSYLYGMVGAYM
ncbi:MAG: hypothetical protein E6163_00520 [Peptoniphilus lacydonensis]|uniref:hypothetical protein n=1 Tax=Peptoniphilus lacydonensis TaxID=1673725 RepID=UPI002913D73C|nr:hypothetical protein [Peptoniphilus lacydonensis]MDU5274383.1 hypothetical protein [Peptoniphilus lacydonensis]